MLSSWPAAGSGGGCEGGGEHGGGGEGGGQHGEGGKAGGISSSSAAAPGGGSSLRRSRSRTVSRCCPEARRIE